MYNILVGQGSIKKTFIGWRTVKVTHGFFFDRFFFLSWLELEPGTCHKPNWRGVMDIWAWRTMDLPSCYSIGSFMLKSRFANLASDGWPREDPLLQLLLRFDGTTLRVLKPRVFFSAGSFLSWFYVLICMFPFVHPPIT